MQQTNFSNASMVSVFSPSGANYKPLTGEAHLFNSMEHYKNLNLENIEGEIWKPITGYEGLYEISNFGRLKTLSKKIGNSISEAKIKIIAVGNRGYLLVNLWKNGKPKPHIIHRLVGMAFIENPEKKKTVNHKNTIKSDNHVSNLEWATQEEQMNHAIKMGLLKVTYERKLEMSASRIGRKRTEETKKKMAKSAMLAHKLRRESNAYYPKKGEGVRRKFTVSILNVSEK